MPMMPTDYQQYNAKTRRHDPEFGCSVAKVLPGEFFVTADGTAMTTVLGSCVAVCLHDRERAIGGMNHFLLPEYPGAAPDSFVSLRYGKQAIDVLITEMLKAGAAAARLEAKIFGGACVIHGLLDDIGQRNARFAREYLESKNIRVAAADLEGTAARKIVYFPSDGRVLCKKIHDGSQKTVANLEYQAQHAMQARTSVHRGSAPAHGLEHALKESTK
jgi:chemotaxis protein CheD